MLSFGAEFFVFLRFRSEYIRIKTNRTIILPVVFYGCETWSLTLREERRLKVFENRVLRRIFGPERGEVTGEWSKPHNELLSDLSVLLTKHYSDDQIEKKEMGGASSRYGEEAGCTQGFGVKT